MIAGSTIYILSNPEDVTEMYKNSAVFSFREILEEGLVSLGSSRAIAEKLSRRSASTSGHYIRSFGEQAHGWQVQQTSGKGLSVMDSRIQKYFEEELLVSKMRPECEYVVEAKNDDIIVSLRKWSREVLMSAIQEAYFGSILFRIDPGLIQSLIRYDAAAWQLVYRLPWFLSRQARVERARIVNSLKIYFETPLEKRSDAAWYIQTLEQEYRSLGFNNEEIATLVLATYWGMIINVSKAIFWMLARIVHDEELLDEIRQETSPAFAKGNVDIEHILHSCPTASSVWLETLRFTTAYSSVRHITTDTVLGGMLLRRGNKVMTSPRQFHFSDAAFGRDSLTFDPKRFSKHPSLQRHINFQPFGGGATLCAGRFLAQHMALMFTAITLHRLDLKLAKPQPFPRVDESNPPFGIITSLDDVLLKLSPR